MLTHIVSKPLSDMRRTLDEHSKSNAIVEVNTQESTLNQRDKDRQFRVNTFANKVTQYHAGDLFDIDIKDLAEHARHLIPNLAPLVGQLISPQLILSCGLIIGC